MSFFLIERIAGFQEYNNLSCSLIDKYICNWEGFGSMRIVNKSLKRGCYQLIVSFSSNVVESTNACVGISTDPWQFLYEGKIFSFNDHSVCYTSNGRLLTFFDAVEGNAAWSPNSSGKIVVGMEVALRKKQSKSKLIYFMHNRRQPCYHVGIPSPCIFGVSGGQPGTTCSILKFVKLKKLHFAPTKKDVAQQFASP